MTAAGKYLLLQLFPNGSPNSNQLYYADLEKFGEINGKIPLKPVYTADMNTEFNVSSKLTVKKAMRKSEANLNE